MKVTIGLVDLELHQETSREHGKGPSTTKIEGLLFVLCSMELFILTKREGSYWGVR